MNVMRLKRVLSGEVAGQRKVIRLDAFKLLLERNSSKEKRKKKWEKKKWKRKKWRKEIKRDGGMRKRSEEKNGSGEVKTTLRAINYFFLPFHSFLFCLT